LNLASNHKTEFSLKSSSLLETVQFSKFLGKFTYRDRVVRGSTIIQHHIFSSIWCSVKDEVSVLKENCTWLLGDGKDINFWNDSWCGPPLLDQLSIPDHICKSLTASVSDFIVEGNWVIHSQLSIAYPNLYSIISQITIHLVVAKDKLLRKLSDDGDL
jgi:hypothetical protein